MASSSSATQPISHVNSQRIEILPGYMQQMLQSYSGNTEESKSSVLARLEEDLRNHPAADLIQVKRRERTNRRLGGIEIAMCRDCAFSGTFQKVAEHRTSIHWELKLWSCVSEGW
jgi:hypothetical protein